MVRSRWLRLRDWVGGFFSRKFVSTRLEKVLGLSTNEESYTHGDVYTTSSSD